MNVTEIIARATYLSGIAGRSLNTVESEEGKDGLFFLNLLLSEKAITGDYIPYYSHFQIATIQGQEIYFLPNVVTVDAVTFNFDTVRYVLRQQNRRKYFGVARANVIQSLPYIYYVETVLGGANLYLYFLPNQVYNVNVTARLQLAPVTYSDDLDLIFDDFYQSLLIYELTERFCEFYLISMNPQVASRLAQLRSEIRARNPLDFSQQKVSTLDKMGGFSYAQVNIGKGWTT